MQRDFFEVVESRRSIRAFLNKEVDEDSLMKILQAANSAPSAGDLQAYEIVVVRDSRRREKLASAAFGQGFVARAPLVLVFVADPKRSSRRYGRRGSDLYCIQDATIGACYAQLAAHALGLGSVWVGAFDDDAVLDVIGATPDLVPVAMIAIGHPAENPEKRPRRALHDLVRLEDINYPFKTK
jgi:nitroreductase